MKFHELPVVFLSYKEDKALENYAALKQQVSHVIHVEGVKGFDAAHREAARQAKEWAVRAGIDVEQHPYFITVDADNTVRPEFWLLDTDQMDHSIYYRDTRPGPARTVLSWNAYNPITGLAYGNGGLKLWGYEFINNMVTHEHAQEVVVDFCWTPGYLQLAPIYSTTMPGSGKQAFTAGFREGVKMPLVGGQADLKTLYEVKGRAYPTNLERLLAWSSIGAHARYGYWSMLGAMMGFVQCHIEHKFGVKDVSDIDKVYEVFDTWKEAFDALREKEGNVDIPDYFPALRKNIQRMTDLKIPNFGPTQSQYVVDRTRPVLHTNPFEVETWPPKFDPSV